MSWLFQKVKEHYGKIALFGIVLAILYSAYAFYTFSKQSEQLTKNANKSQLEEIALQSASSVRELSIGLSDYIKASAEAFYEYDDLLSEESLSTLERISDHSRFDRVRIVMPNYISYGPDGDGVDISGSFVPLKAFTQGISGVSGVFESPLTLKNIILFYSPIRNIKGEIVASIAGTYEVESLSDSTKIESFSGKGYVDIIEPDGCYIISSSGRKYAFKHYENLEFISEGDVNSLISDINENKPGLLQYIDDGEVFYTYYQPVGVNGWYVLQTLPESVIDSQTGYIEDISLALMIKSLGFFALVVLSIWILSHYSQKDIRSLRNLLDSVVNTVPGGVIKCSALAPDFTFEYISDGFLDLIDCTREDLDYGLAGGLLDSVYAEDKERIRQVLDAQDDDTTLQLEYRVVTFTGNIKWVLNNCTRFTDSMDNKPYIYGVCIDNTEARKTRQELQISNERLQSAISQTPSIVFEYEIENRRLHFLNRYNAYYGLPTSLENGPSYMVKNNIVESTHGEQFLKCFESFSDSNTNMISFNLRLRRSDGNLIWHRLSISSIFDPLDQKTRLIGAFVDISLFKEAMSRHKVEKKYRDAMLSDAMATFEINLTTDKYSTTDYSTNHYIKEQSNYSKQLKQIADKYLYPEDKEQFMSIFNRRNLLSEFESGRAMFYNEFRQLDEQGNVVWTSYTLNILVEPGTEDVKAIGYIKDIDTRKRTELAIKHSSERDSLTGLYNRRAALALISGYLNNPDNENKISGFMTLDLDRLKEINDTYGHLTGDDILIKIAEHLSSYFRENDIIARMGGDEFLVFMKNVHNRTDIYARAVKTCDEIKNLRAGEDEGASTTVSVGISIYPVHGSTFEELYKNSDTALYRAKRTGKNKCVIYDPIKDNQPDSI